MLIFFWILAFVGVALIYPVPYFGEKAGLSQNTIAFFKVVGVLVALISLLALHLNGGFN